MLFNFHLYIYISTQQHSFSFDLFVLSQQVLLERELHGIVQEVVVVSHHYGPMQKLLK